MSNPDLPDLPDLAAAAAVDGGKALLLIGGLLVVGFVVIRDIRGRRIWHASAVGFAGSALLQLAAGLPTQAAVLALIAAFLFDRQPATAHTTTS